MTTDTHDIEIRSIAHVNPQAIRACLNEIGRKDPLVVPPRSGSMVGHFRAACVGEAVVGVGWLYRRQGRAELDVRVTPRYRKQGVGSLLFDYLTKNNQFDLYAGCDTAQKTADRFLLKRGFNLHGVLFAQRWDGEIEDVPSAFATVSLRETVDRDEIMTMLNQCYENSWFNPALGPEDFDRADVETQIAWRDDRPVGCMVARITDDTVWIAAIGTVPQSRGLGVGRAMLSNVMQRVATEQKGIVLLTPADDEFALKWTRSLGFWTYRSWNQYVLRPGA